MDASVRKRPRSVRGASDLPETKIVAKRRTVVTFYVSHYKSVNAHRDPGGRGRETLSSLLDSSRVFASQKCQRSQGSGGRGRETLSSLLDSSRVFASQECQRSQGSGGRGRETQNCRHSWTRLGSSSSLLDSPLERGKERGERRKER